MAEKTVNTRIQFKHDIESNWLKVEDFIPKNGEVIIYDAEDSHTRSRMKIGNGYTNV